MRSASRAAIGTTRPHWRTHACGAVCFTTSSKASPICGSRCTCRCPSTKSGMRPKASQKLCIWLVISATSASCLKRRRIAWTNVAASGRKAPSLSGVKLLLKGRNGAVSARCRPIATRGPAEFSTSSAIASERRKLGAATSTEVALRRPRTTRSRIAVLTAFEMPKSSAHSQMRRWGTAPAPKPSRLSANTGHPLMRHRPRRALRRAPRGNIASRSDRSWDCRGR